VIRRPVFDPPHGGGTLVQHHLEEVTVAIVQRSKFCKNCGKNTLHQYQSFSTPMGCLLTILTGGLFALFWIPYVLLIEPFRNIYRCQACGKGRIF
jgi:hypothetical protein